MPERLRKGATTVARGSGTHLVLIPTYNTGEKVCETVRGALQYWSPVWVVVDGSTDGTAEFLSKLETEAGDDLRVFVLPRNKGKGAAVLHGVEAALEEGFTHVLTMDADGQHPASEIRKFMRISEEDPGALVLGEPVFDAGAPALRVNGRKVSNWWANLETLWEGINDSLFGFRVYPAGALRSVMLKTRFARRFDFDAETAVKLVWKGVRPVNVKAPVRYLTAEEGGVSQFRYLRDNILLTWMHTRLFFGFLARLPYLIARRFGSSHMTKK